MVGADCSTPTDVRQMSELADDSGAAGPGTGGPGSHAVVRRFSTPEDPEPTLERK
jgi:hypothetical protein